MAAPSYTEDLTDIDLAESGSTGWTAFNISGGGGGAPAFGADFGMQGGGCWDKAASNAERAAAVNKTPGTGTVAAGVHIFQWGFVATPGVTDTLANRGAYVLIGTSITNFMQFHVEGNNTYGAQGRTGKCYVVDYHTTANTGSIPYATSNGSPGATPTYFGFGINTTATVKGSNFGVDAVRYGTGGYLTAGELISAGDASDDPCTFTGFQTQNDNNSNRWGILTSIGGANMELQGIFAIGQNNAGTATLARFADSDINILFVDTVHSATNFTQIIIDHASTRAELTNINLTALGTRNPGIFSVTSADPDVFITGGSWTDIGLTTLRANTTVDGTTWRGADQVITNGATISNATFDSLTNASQVTVPDVASAALITDSIFTSPGTGNGIEIGGTAGNFTFTGIDFNNYSLTVDANKAIYVNIATGTVNITISGGSGVSASSHVRTAGATIVVNSDVTATFSNLKDNSEIRIYTAGTNTELAGIEDAIAGSPDARTFAAAIPAATSVDYVIHNFNPGDDIYQTIRVNAFSWPTTDTTIVVQQQIDRNAEN